MTLLAEKVKAADVKSEATILLTTGGGKRIATQFCERAGIVFVQKCRSWNSDKVANRVSYKKIAFCLDELRDGGPMPLASRVWQFVDDRMFPYDLDPRKCDLATWRQDRTVMVSIENWKQQI